MAKKVVVPAPKGSELKLESKAMIKASADRVRLQQALGDDPVDTRVKHASALGKHGESNLYKKPFSKENPPNPDQVNATIRQEIYDGKRPPVFQGDNVLTKPKRTWQEAKQKMAEKEAEYIRRYGPLK